MFCCATTKTDYTLDDDLAVNDEGLLQGRNVCACSASKIIFTIAIVAGLILLLLGWLAFVGYSAEPSSDILQKLHASLIDVSTYLGTDPLIVCSFPTAFGLAFVVTGSIELLIQPPAKPKSTNPFENDI
jgi:hypothetical protein